MFLFLFFSSSTSSGGRSVIIINGLLNHFHLLTGMWVEVIACSYDEPVRRGVGLQFGLVMENWVTKKLTEQPQFSATITKQIFAGTSV